MRRRPYECLEPLALANASPPFSLIRLTFDAHRAATDDRGQKRDPMPGIRTGTASREDPDYRRHSSRNRRLELSTNPFTAAFPVRCSAKDAALLPPVQDRVRGQFRAVVADNHRRATAAQLNDQRPVRRTFTRLASASIENGLVRTCMPGSR